MRASFNPNPFTVPHFNVKLNSTVTLRVYLTEESITGSVRAAYLMGITEGEQKAKEKQNG